MEHVGMDLGKKESQIAIITEAGELIEKRMRTERERLVAYFKDRPKAKILIEARGVPASASHLGRAVPRARVADGAGQPGADARAVGDAGTGDREPRGFPGNGRQQRVLL
jgi:hypothetical protein